VPLEEKDVIAWRYSINKEQQIVALILLAVAAVVVWLFVKHSIDKETKKNVKNLAKILAILFGVLIVLIIIMAISLHH